MLHTSRRFVTATAALGATAAVLAASVVGPPAQAARDEGDRQAYRAAVSARDDLVRLDLLAINDFHGNLEEIPSSSSSGRINNTPAGGAEFLATHLKRLRTKAHTAGGNTLTVAAGDLVGASPLLSAAFHDEPTIEALNRGDRRVPRRARHRRARGVLGRERHRRRPVRADAEHPHRRPALAGRLLLR